MFATPKLVVFDINHTLIQDDTWAHLNIALGMTAPEDQVLWSLNQQGVLSNSQWVAIVNKLYKKRGLATRQLVESVVCSYTYHQGAKELVMYLKDSGYTLVLISGAMNILVEHVANDLGIENYAYCSEFVFDANNMLSHFTYLNNDAVAKKKLFLELCKKLHVDPAVAICVGDGANEAELFAIGKGITFTGSKLQDAAWRVVDDLASIKDIL